MAVDHIAEHRQAQADRFDKESARYEETHSSAAAQAYRDKFYRRRLFDIDLKDRDVLDAMCASGIDTSFLISKGGRVSGLDISPECAKIYRDRYDRPCSVASIDQTGLPDASLDVVYISGGLHHVIPMLESTLKEIHRVLRPSVVFCFVEPNSDTWANKLREIWYKRDSRFTDEERGISYSRELLPRMKSIGFAEDDKFAGGNIAYLLVQQANVLGTSGLVKTLSPLLFAAERFFGWMPFSPKLYFCARWRKV